MVKFLRFATKAILQEEDILDPTGFIVTSKGIGMVPLPFQDKIEALRVFGSDINIVTGKQIGRASCRARVSAPV